MKIASLLVSFLDRIYSIFNLIDENAFRDISELIREAVENQWYISPKEIPIDIEAFSSRLSEDFDINSQYFATIYLFNYVFKTNLIKNDILRKVINKFFQPFFVFTDNRLAKEEIFLRETIVAPTYAFYVWECVLK